MKMKPDLKVDDKSHLIDKQVLSVSDAEGASVEDERSVIRNEGESIFHLRNCVGEIYEDLKEEDYNLVCVLSFFITMFLFFNTISTYFNNNAGFVDSFLKYADMIFHMTLLVFSAFVFHYGAVIIFFALVSFFVKLTKKKLSYFYKKRFLKTGKSVADN